MGKRDSLQIREISGPVVCFKRRTYWLRGWLSSQPHPSTMSRRRSTGDLVPRDITEILAREARAQRGHKKPGLSLGQAFSWLKGSRKKKSVANGPKQAGVGTTESKMGLQNHEPAKGERVEMVLLILEG